MLPDHGVWRVGRAAECEVRLLDPTASRVQFELRVDGREVWMKDLGSRFGTLVNGVKTSECQLRPGDVITAGETTLRLSDEGAVLRTTIAPTAGAYGQAIASSPVAKSDEEIVASPSKPAAIATVNPRKLPGRQFGRFDVRDLIAETSSGVLLRAEDKTLQTTVALKVFRAETMNEPAAAARFQRAARTVLPLTHPHLIELYAFGEDEGLCWTASEWIEGENAAQVIRRIGIAGMLDWRHSLKMALHVAKALEFASSHQILHRNLAPHRILIRNSDGVVKLGGLGLAKSLDDDASAKVTKAGEIVGDLAYCSPEQVSGKRLDGRSDLYNLGATLYALLTGRPPCEGTSFHETLNKIQNDRPEPPTKYHLAIPPLFEGVVMKLLAKRPDDRFDDAQHLLRDLTNVAKYVGETSLLQ